MPAMLEDPTAPVIYRTSGPPPYPSSIDPAIPPTIEARQLTLRDRSTIATLMPFASLAAVPPRLLEYLADQLNIEIEKGDTYPMVHPMATETFGAYWFQNFGAIMVLGNVGNNNQVARMEHDGARWEELCLGSFYVKPNYPGRSSHVCNGGFLVTQAARNKGVGRLMGEVYLDWAPKLGYSYSIFNLVYENNVASCRIWDALGFKRVGRVKGAGNLRSHPNELVDAIVYGRDLGPEAEDYVSEERFDKIRFYLKHGKYPQGSDRAEKSRLRSAATHYKLLPAEDGDDREDSERLMLKDKEVISDPKKQYDIARQIHQESHGGINKTTATIAEKYHWVRIKETVSLVIKNCHECKDANQRAPSGRPAKSNNSTPDQKPNKAPTPTPQMVEQLISFSKPTPTDPQQSQPPPDLRVPQSPHGLGLQQVPGAPVAQMHSLPEYSNMPLDPQIMQAQRHSNPSDIGDGMRQVAEYTRAPHLRDGYPPGERMDVDEGRAGDYGDGGRQPDSVDHVEQVQGQPEEARLEHNDDTRLATERHVSHGDQPMAYQDQDRGLHRVDAMDTDGARE